MDTKETTVKQEGVTAQAITAQQPPPAATHQGPTPAQGIVVEGEVPGEGATQQQQQEGGQAQEPKPKSPEQELQPDAEAVAAAAAKIPKGATAVRRPSAGRRSGSAGSGGRGFALSPGLKVNPDSGFLEPGREPAVTLSGVEGLFTKLGAQLTGDLAGALTGMSNKFDKLSYNVGKVQVDVDDLKGKFELAQEQNEKRQDGYEQRMEGLEKRAKEETERSIKSYPIVSEVTISGPAPTALGPSASAAGGSGGALSTMSSSSDASALAIFTSVKTDGKGMLRLCELEQKVPWLMRLRKTVAPGANPLYGSFYREVNRALSATPGLSAFDLKAGLNESLLTYKIKQTAAQGEDGMISTVEFAGVKTVVAEAVLHSGSRTGIIALRVFFDCCAVLVTRSSTDTSEADFKEVFQTLRLMAALQAFKPANTSEEMREDDLVTALAAFKLGAPTSASHPQDSGHQLAAQKEKDQKKLLVEKEKTKAALAEKEAAAVAAAEKVAEKDAEIKELTAKNKKAEVEAKKNQRLLNDALQQQ